MDENSPYGYRHSPNSKFGPKWSKETPLFERKTALGQRGVIYRYPRTFQVVAISFAFCIMASKPIYDLYYMKHDNMDITEEVKRPSADNIQ